MANQLTRTARFAEGLAKKAYYDRVAVERAAVKKVEDARDAAGYMYGMDHARAVQTVQNQFVRIADLEGQLEISEARRVEAEARMKMMEEQMEIFQSIVSGSVKDMDGLLNHHKDLQQFFSGRKANYSEEDNVRIDAVNETIGSMLGYEIPRRAWGNKLVIDWIEGEERKILAELIRLAHKEIGEDVYMLVNVVRLNADGMSIQNNAKKRLGINKNNWSCFVDEALNRA